jgi:hypothetical protein
MQPGRAAMIPMITHCILATRAHGLEILDGPYSDISNIDGFATECAQGRDLGFDGKTLIHPSHIEACNAIFTPPAEEVAQARKIIAAFERPENAARGAIHDGMIPSQRVHLAIEKVQGEAFDLGPRPRQMHGAGIAQLEIMAIADVAGGAQADHCHSGGNGSPDSTSAVLDDKTFVRGHAQFARGEQENVRVRLSGRDHVRAENMTAEFGFQRQHREA